MSVSRAPGHRFPHLLLRYNSFFCSHARLFNPLKPPMPSCFVRTMLLPSQRLHLGLWRIFRSLTRANLRLRRSRAHLSRFLNPPGETPRASFIPAQGIALGSSAQHKTPSALKARFILAATRRVNTPCTAIPSLSCYPEIRGLSKSGRSETPDDRVGTGFVMVENLFRRHLPSEHPIAWPCNPFFIRDGILKSVVLPHVFGFNSHEIAGFDQFCLAPTNQTVLPGNFSLSAPQRI